MCRYNPPAEETDWITLLSGSHPQQFSFLDFMPPGPITKAQSGENFLVKPKNQAAAGWKIG